MGEERGVRGVGWGTIVKKYVDFCIIRINKHIVQKIAEIKKKAFSMQDGQIKGDE